MLPLILGGVALTAIEYGLAKLFEDNNCKDTYTKSDDIEENYTTSSAGTFLLLCQSLILKIMLQW